MSKPRGNSRFRKGGWRVALCAAALALALGVSALIGALPVTATKLDITDQRLYTLSDATNALLDGLQSDVSVLYLAESGAEDLRLRELIARYEARSPRVHFRYIAASDALYYTAQELSSYSVIVTNGEFDAVIDYTALYSSVYEVSGYYQYLTDYLFQAEDKLNKAIANVTGDLPIAYLLSDHAETAPESGLSALLGEAGTHEKSLYLSEISAVPEDAAMVIVNAPQTDITESEADMLTAYLNGGGSVLLATDTKYGELANLSAFAARAGLAWLPGVVMEADTAYLYNADYPYYLLPEATEDPLAARLSQDSLRALVSLSHAIGLTGAEGSEARALLETSEKAYLKPTAYTDGVMTYAEGDAMGPFALAAVSETMSGGKLFWVASAQCLTDAIDEMSGGANYALAAQSISWLHGGAEPLVESVPAVSMMTASPEHTEARASFTLAALYAPPALALIVGLVMALRGRGKKRANAA